MILVLSLLLACCSKLAISYSAVKSLPGFQGPLPFELETGCADSSLVHFEFHVCVYEICVVRSSIRYESHADI